MAETRTFSWMKIAGLEPATSCMSTMPKRRVFAICLGADTRPTKSHRRWVLKSLLIIANIPEDFNRRANKKAPFRGR